MAAEPRFRVYLSGTFTDLNEERNGLQERVFPRLRDYCLQHAARFEVVDMRWAVSEEAALDQQMIKICLDEIERCRTVSPRLNFLVLLGDRLGWRPPPPEIPSVDFDEILKHVSPDEDGLLREWYLRDDNAVPALYYLRPRTGDFVGWEAWAPVEEALRAVLEKAIQDVSLQAADRVKYEGSWLEQEIDHGALRTPGGGALFFARTIEDLPEDESARGYVDLDSRGRRDHDAGLRLARLRERLRSLLPEDYREYAATWIGADPNNPDRPPFTTDHIPQLCEDVYEALRSIIDRELERPEQVNALEEPRFVGLDSMEPGDAGALLDRWLEDSGRSLQPHQREEVLRKFEVERLPLWLRLAFEEARRWRSSAGLPEIELPPTIPEIIRKKLFAGLCDDANHGEVMVSRSLSYLAAATNGLSVDELLDVLSRDPDVVADFERRMPHAARVHRLPMSVWSRLHSDLEPYLAERVADGAVVLTFSHRQIAEAVAYQFLAGAEGVARHRALADYFAAQPDVIGGDGGDMANYRKLSELPYQEEMAARLEGFDSSARDQNPR